jgi:hypothetical protein
VKNVIAIVDRVLKVLVAVPRITMVEEVVPLGILEGISVMWVDTIIEVEMNIEDLSEEAMIKEEVILEKFEQIVLLHRVIRNMKR